MIKRIVIFSTSDDIHAFALKKKAGERGTACEIVDTSQFPENNLTVYWDDTKPVLEFTSDTASVLVDQSTSVWWRRPQLYQPSLEVTDDRLRRFIVAECATTVEGALDACGCYIINDIFNQRRASNKIYQLVTAAAHGFRFPETLVTNSDRQARDFHLKHNRSTIFKGQTDGKYHLGETRPVTDDILERSSSLRFAPVIFQEFIPCKYDIRVTVIGDNVFSTRIESQYRRDLIDWRIDQQVPMASCELPPSIKSRCIDYVKSLGLVYGAIDLRETPSGDIVFFEINPSGQFLFCDLESDLPITTALYHTLAEGRRM